MGFRVWRLGVEVWGLGLRAQVPIFQEMGFRVQGSGFEARGAGVYKPGDMGRMTRARSDAADSEDKDSRER